MTGSGTGELLDAIVETFPKNVEEEIEENVPRFAIIGRPNVGKSSFINALIGVERNMVTDIAGTTRDTIEEDINLRGVHFRFIDTAGIRETIDVIERSGVQRAYEKIGQSAVVLYLFDVFETSVNELKDLTIRPLVPLLIAISCCVSPISAPAA